MQIFVKFFFKQINPLLFHLYFIEQDDKDSKIVKLITPATIKILKMCNFVLNTIQYEFNRPHILHITVKFARTICEIMFAHGILVQIYQNNS